MRVRQRVVLVAALGWSHLLGASEVTAFGATGDGRTDTFDRNPRYNYGNSQDANGGIVFRRTRDATLTGLHLNGIWRQPAALLLEACDRFNLANCTVLDSDGVGVWLRDTTNTRVSGCMIRDDRADRKPAPSLQVTGGRGNWIQSNLLAHGHDLAAGAARAEGNIDGKPD